MGMGKAVDKGYAFRQRLRRTPHWKIPKKANETEKGRMLTDTILKCITMYGLEDQVRDGEALGEPLDFTWKDLSFGWECKNFLKKGTGYGGKDYVWFRSSLQTQVLDRFDKQEEAIGKPIKYRGLVVSEKRWNDETDCWLSAQRPKIHLCEVGRVDAMSDTYRLDRLWASMLFMEWFEDMVWAICSGEEIGITEVK